MKEINGDTSDGFHTFNELYEFRMLYNALLFNDWGKDKRFDVHKSKRHSDGKECFGGGWFVVVALLPSGQISNHYREEHWDLFSIPSFEKARYAFDGHTSKDVMARLKSLLENTK